MKKLLYTVYLLSLFIVYTVKAQSIPGPCSNPDFELSAAGVYTTANAVSGWTISSQTATSCVESPVWLPGSPEFSIMSTPVNNVPYIGNLPNSPFGGSKIAVLNNTVANANRTKLAQTFTVASSVSLFSFAYAGAWQGGGHNCCEEAHFKLQVKDCQGNILPCPSFSIGAGNCQNGLTYNIQNGVKWADWRLQTINLGNYAGNCITIEIISSDCIYGDHYGRIYFDAQCFSPPNPAVPLPPAFLCPGSTTTTLYGPLGFQNYLWIAPAGSPISVAQSTLATMTVTNAVVNSIYTLSLLTYPYGCPQSLTYTVQTNTLSITGVGASPSCSMGASGSATVVTNMRDFNLNYTWTNAANNVVGTGSIVSSLMPGSYTVSIAAQGHGNCGTATAAVTVGVRPAAIIPSLSEYCGNEAYLAVNGTNVQWYNGTVTIPANQGGTATSYTVINPVAYTFYTATYLSPQGCRDSLKITLLPTPPGTITVTSNSPCITGLGQATITLFSTLAQSTNYFEVADFSSPTPAYYAALGPTSATTFTAGNLSPNGIYKATVFDGLCNYTKTFTVDPLPSFNYSIHMPAQLCSGLQYIASLNFITPPTAGQYTYSWSPNTFLISNNTVATMVSPVIVPLSATMVYTVAVTPTLAYCPLIKTVTVTIFNPVTPTVSAIPPLCSGSPTQAIVAYPPGGIFYSTNTGNGLPVSAGGILRPPASIFGLNTFTYTNSMGSCHASTTGTYWINGVNVAINNTYTMICSGQSLTLTASGADLYAWSNGATSSSIIISPASNITYSVTGTKTINACSDTKNAFIAVYTIPQLTLSGTPTVCAGQTATVHASGADTYSWSTGAYSTPALFSPTISTRYYVTGGTGSWLCTSRDSITINVFGVPSLSISGNTTICIGETSRLTASGANTYTWNEHSTSAGISVSPTLTSVYSVTGTQANCSGTASLTVNVERCTELNKNPADIIIAVYPSLNKGFFFIETPVDCRIFIYDQLGLLVLEKEILKGKQEISLHGSANGIYIIKALCGQAIFVKKIIKSG